MKIPKQVTVGGKKISVVLEDLTNTDCVGYYLHDQLKIGICSTLSDCEKIKTLKHETMEACLFISGVAWCETMETEAVVRAFEELFFEAWEAIEKKLND